MSAISAVLSSLILSGEYTNIIYGSELYCDTPSLIAYIGQNMYKHQIDVTNTNCILELFNTKVKNKSNILFLESCSNPNGYVFDFNLIKSLRELSQKLCVIIDNTWLTDLIFNPFNYGADIVVVSLTKYYSGGNAIAGAIIGNNLYQFREYTNHHGLHVSPYNIEIIISNISLMEARFKKSSELTLKILTELSNSYNITHPYLPKHVSNHFVNKYFNKNYCPCVFTFKVNMVKEKSLDILKHFLKIEHKTSFGGATTRTDPWPKRLDNNTTSLCRIAIGYSEEYQQVFPKIKELLDKFK